MGVYAATKHALEGWTETLDHEVRGFGVRALVIEPYFTRTNIVKNARSTQAALDVYASARRRTMAAIQREIVAGDPARAVAEMVHRAASDAVPRLRYPVGRAIRFSRLRRFIPATLFDRSLRKQFQLD
jgi:NAD(P)-dependent dehydrogenase (short-subunit alcohol dehydrogenase family)